MKKLWFFFVVILSLVFVSVLAAQNVSPQFSELKGMEDGQGNTHLFYRIFSSIGAYPYSHSSNNSIYHFDLDSNTDTFFLYEGGSSDILFNSWITVDDYSFWNNDPSKYIYCGSEIGIDPIGYIKRYDQGNGFYYGFGGFNIDISRQNDSLIFVNLGQIFISTDGGMTWNEALQQSDFNFISLSPFNDNVMYGYNPPGKLLKSIDRGINYSVVDTFRSNDSYSTEFYYDTDETHLYRINRHFPQYYLSVSDNQGEPFSWSNKYFSNNPIFFSNDESQSSAVYLADGKKIFFSLDYGSTFNLYKELDNRIIGIYKKPNSEILYAASKYRIYEICPDSTSIIKSLPIPNELLNYYPLALGNYWIYKMEIWDNWPIISYSEDTFTRRVVSKEILSNNKEYFKIEETYHGSTYTNYVYERIDSANGLVYRFDNQCSNSDSEKVIDDLISEVGDSLLTQRFTVCWDSILTLFLDKGNENILNENRNYKSFEYNWLMSYNYKLAQGLGIHNIRWGYDFGSTEFLLKGCVIDDIIYGDTTLTGVEDENNLTPTEFYLGQNFPNPYNSQTTISYSIPNSSLVQIQIFDVLGKAVLTLLNEEKSSGNYKLSFNASELTSGVYFYQLRAGDFVETKKMVFLK
jgi:hypothetical protein